MRFIGNKENLVEKIYLALQARGIKGESFFDFFAGTANVGKFFKKKGYQVFSCDLLYFSHVLQKSYLENNQEPAFTTLLPELRQEQMRLFATPLVQVLDFLNALSPREGFIYHNYTPEGTERLRQPRMYFTSENGRFIDAVRQQIEDWWQKGLIGESEYFILLACLIETVPFYANISGVYAAFQKRWDPRALKKMRLRPIEIIKNDKQNRAFHGDSIQLISQVKCDILYLDPPYNQRQYAANYHLLETIAKYDAPTVRGVSGMRDYENQKSAFCNADAALRQLRYIAQNASYQTLLLSYNSEGIMSTQDILNTLAEFGAVELIEFDYPRFKSNSNGGQTQRQMVKEHLYILQRYAD